MHAPSPPVGQAVTLSPGLRRVIAPNPSPMTYWGTNTYLLGQSGPLAVIDPGPADAAHLSALLAAIGDQTVSHIIVTHSHLDHSPLARPLAEAVGAPVHAFGPHTAGRSAAMQDLVAGGMRSGGEGIDTAFVPDVTLPDGAVLEGRDWRLEVLHTPGHLGNHICLDWEGRIFTGDHVMGWASSLVSPPDGDLTDFNASCHALKRRQASVYHPGHGAPIDEPEARLDWLIAHRQGREAQILSVLAGSPDGLTLAALTASAYRDTPAHLHPAAARNVLAHLIDLRGRNRVRFDAPLRDETVFSPN